MKQKKSAQTQPSGVVILGVGNILLKDEGVGVRVIERLRQTYHFPENVSLIDGATTGLDLLPAIRNTEQLIIIDAINAQQEPGYILRLAVPELSAQIQAKSSLHQTGLLEALEIARRLDGKLPHTVIFGIQPEDATHFGLELTPLIASRVPRLMTLILAELAALNIPVKQVPENG